MLAAHVLILFGEPFSLTGGDAFLAGDRVSSDVWLIGFFIADDFTDFSDASGLPCSYLPSEYLDPIDHDRFA